MRMIIKLAFSKFIVIYIVLVQCGYVKEAHAFYPEIAFKSGLNIYLYRGGAEWQSINVKQKESYGESVNTLALSKGDVLVLRDCIAGNGCNVSLSMSDISRSEFGGLKHQDGLDFHIIDASNDIFVVIKNPRDRAAIYINSSLHHPKPIVFMTNASTVDLASRSIIYSRCANAQKGCELLSYNLERQEKNVVTSIPYGVYDVVVRGGNLYVIGTKESAKNHPLTNLLSWSGHGEKYYDWYLIEINLITGKLEEVLLIKEDVDNGEIYFYDKWGAFK